MALGSSSRLKTRRIVLCFCLALFGTHCGKALPAALAVAPEAARSDLASLVVFPIDPGGVDGKLIDPEIRRLAEELPGQLKALSDADACGDEYDGFDAEWRAAAENEEAFVGDPLALVRLLRCVGEEGGTAALIPSFRRVSAPFNLGMAFFCGGARSIRPVRANPFASVEQSNSRGTTVGICFEVSVFNLAGKKIYAGEFPFATTSRLKAGQVMGFDRVPFSDFIEDAENRAEGLEATIQPLVDVFR